MENRSVPFFTLQRHIDALRPVLDGAIKQVMDSQQFIGGKFVEQFEQQAAAYLGVNHAIANNSGTDALWMALQALDIKPGDIVLTTPFSFIASSSEIVAHGAHPVFIDIDPATFNLCPKTLATWLTTHAVKTAEGKTVHRKTGLAIPGMIVVDLFGQCADYSAIKAIAQEWSLWIVEDCAQAIGARIDKTMAGTFGTIGTYSFYPTKNLGAFGDGGLCVTNDPVLARKLLQIRNHGRISHYEYEGMGINSRLDGMQAALLSVKLPHLDQANKRRADIAMRYNQAFNGLSNIAIPRTITGQHVYHQYTLVINAQDSFTRTACEHYLTAHGVGTRVFYPQALPEIPFLRTHPDLQTACPVADRYAQSVLSLPVFPELTDAEVDYVIATVKAMHQALAPAKTCCAHSHTTL